MRRIASAISGAIVSCLTLCDSRTASVATMLSVKTSSLIGEAATRAATTDPDALAAWLRGPEFLVAGFKGQGQSFRAWDGQMRQPILIAGPRLLVSVSPQPGYLHRSSELDTLGTDRDESKCGK